MSTSPVLTLTVVKRTATSMTLTLFAESLGGRPAGSLHRKAVPAAATGSVQFVDGTTVIATVAHQWRHRDPSPPPR